MRLAMERELLHPHITHTNSIPQTSLNPYYSRSQGYGTSSNNALLPHRVYGSRTRNNYFSRGRHQNQSSLSNFGVPERARRNFNRASNSYQNHGHPMPYLGSSFDQGRQLSTHSLNYGYMGPLHYVARVGLHSYDPYCNYDNLLYYQSLQQEFYVPYMGAYNNHYGEETIILDEDGELVNDGILLYEEETTILDEDGELVDDGILPSVAETISRNLKTRIYHGNSEGNSDQDEERAICVVCLAAYDNNETIGTLHCGHEYHADCIKEWLSKSNSCPVCRAPGLLIEQES